MLQLNFGGINSKNIKTMKKDILKYILVMFLAVSFAACDDYDQDINYYDSVKLDMSATKFTVLDAELATEIDFMSTSKTVTNVSIEVDGTEISSGTASGNKYALTLDRSNFGTAGDTLGGSFRAYVYATVDGKVKEMYTTFKMVSASSIRVPFVENAKGDEVDEPIYELSDVVKNFTYEVSPKTATGFTVKAETKVGKAGTYATIWDKAYDAEDLDIPFMGSDYNKGDTIFVKVTATAGEYTEVVSGDIKISEYTLGGTAAHELNLEDMAYDLVGDSIIDVAEDAATIKFVSDMILGTQGVMTMNNTMLVKITDADLMKSANLPELKGAYLVGTAVDEVANVTIGDKFIVMHTRDSKDYYGTLEIINSVRTTVEDNNFVEFDYALEVYDEQK